VHVAQQGLGRGMPHLDFDQQETILPHLLPGGESDGKEGNFEGMTRRSCNRSPVFCYSQLWDERILTAKNSGLG
jgi:hypothetical protein